MEIKSIEQNFMAETKNENEETIDCIWGVHQLNK